MIALIEGETIDPRALWKIKRQLSKKLGVPVPSNTTVISAYRDLVAAGSLAENESVKNLLTVKHVRSQSGVAIITLLTMPYPCPGKCVYCPDEVRMPKSYVATEPAAARALTLHFDPYLQTAKRIIMLEKNGHSADKIELIMKGGTWSSYPVDYQQWFIAECFRAMNESAAGIKDIPSPDQASPYSRFTGVEKSSWSVDKLLHEQTINETAPYRCIGLTIETRPDFISTQEIKRLRLLGCTRIEMGLQTTEDKIHTLTQRGHDSAAVSRATKLLKDAGFKVDHHIMPGLPGATPESDLATAKEVFFSPDYQPDTIKLYPCVVTPNTVLEQWWKEGKYTPYTHQQIVPLLSEIKSLVPPYVRIARVIRDFPSTEITAGNKVTNLREDILTYMRDHSLKCRCVRCREAGHHKLLATNKHYSPLNSPEADISLIERPYAASGGTEYFISFEDTSHDVIHAFLRLRFPSPEADKLSKVLPELAGAALIRELHTYGNLISIDQQDTTASQHRGYGKKLLIRAEEMARDAGYAKIAVISGIGVREYYKKQGYTLEGTYMVKAL